MPCTICSLVPFPINEPYKPGLHPGSFPMKASDGKPILTIIKNVTRAQFDQDYKQISIGVPDEVVANSVVEDFVNGLSYTSADARPAIFYVEGEWSQADFEKSFQKEMEAAKERQITWFRTMVKIADDEWQHWHQHKMITDLQRTAAKMLNFKREWLDDSTDMIVKCPACMTLVSQHASVCFACKCVLDPKKYSQFQFLGGTPQQVKA